jgi:peptidase M42 family hydrolase
MKKLTMDTEYLLRILLQLLNIPSPTGYTDAIVHFVGEELERIGIPFVLTRRGAIHCELNARFRSSDRAIVAHLDTLGAMVLRLKENGRLAIAPVGGWPSRFAEGGRVTIFTDTWTRRGTVLPLKASGHVYHKEIADQPTTWENLEVRVDDECRSQADLAALGFQVGDYIAFDTNTETTDNGFINARHLDDKAGVAAVLSVIKAISDDDISIPIDCHFIFTISEEVGSGASAAVQLDVAELVSVDNAIPAPNQNSKETGVTITMMDAAGPYDYHLTHKLINLCTEFDIPHQRDVFCHYRSDAASAIQAGRDLRTALVCFGVDASHGYERTHINALCSLGELLALYVQSPRTFKRDAKPAGPLEGFPVQPT